MKTVLCSLLLLPAATLAQQPPNYGCDSPESRQLDFWVGTWDLSYQSNGKAVKSRNRISKTLDGCAILEEFDGPPATPLVGRSYSVFDRAAKQWKQTWVDNTGAYLDLVGGPMPDGRMHFARESVQGGRKVRTRMVWDDVKADSLRWTWQRSDDEGASWKNVWEIEYRRAK